MNVQDNHNNHSYQHSQVFIVSYGYVDFAINTRFTWSLLAISAIVLSWLYIAPLLFFKKRSIDATLLFTSIFLFPSLNIVCQLTGGNWFASIAIPMSISGVIILWMIRAVFATGLTAWNKLAISMLIGAVGKVVIAFKLDSVLFDGGVRCMESDVGCNSCCNRRHPVSYRLHQKE